MPTSRKIPFPLARDVTFPVAGPGAAGISAPNLLRWSEDLTQPEWAKSLLTVTGNTDTAPDATLTADTITLTNNFHNIKQYFTVTPGQQFTYSFYVKRGTATNLAYSVTNETGATSITGIVSYYSSTNSSTYVRISIPFTVPVDCTQVGLCCVRDCGVTGTLFTWGHQLNAGLTASTYQKTV